MTTSFTPAEYLDASKMLASINELVLLDRFWTAEAASAGASGRQDLDPLVVQMERLLVEVELQSRSVGAAASRRGASLAQSYSALTAEDGPFDARHRAQVVELVESRSQGDVAAFVGAAIADAAARLEPERALLKGELDRLRKGGASGGDLSAEEERALAELAVLASIAFGPEAGVVVEAVGHLLDWLFG